ncbi:cysteine-rich receptor-like protein kinase 10 [Ipomoea triloba]|uniref:cysteine-rich receptor-like protein kinase 10 n=1 Tax=Ipomoea triloba TaxID=35885 RepID=UPI00125D5B20|nr:cysteine-rich receptor-like protein kinase 10 [Ipomoea triloba]
MVGIGAYSCFFCGHALLLLSHASAKDTLAPGESLSYYAAADSLESSNTLYSLKFIERSSSTVTSWYLCIQSSRHPFQATTEYITIWVAWQGQSLFSPELTMSEEGQLIIDAVGEDFIVNNQQPSYVKNTTATLLDNGNLVLQSPGGRTLWQSFDYPTNTWLPGMKLGWFGLKTPRPHQRFLTSWTAQQNPAFTFGVLYPNNNTNTNTKRPQLVLMRRGTVYWQSGVWNGNNFSPIFPYLNFSYFSDENQSYIILNEELHFNLTYILIDATGGVTVEKDGYLSSSTYIDLLVLETGSIQQLVSFNGNNICLTPPLVSLTATKCVQIIVLATPLLLSLLKLEQDANFLHPLPTTTPLMVKLFTFATIPKKQQIEPNYLHFTILPPPAFTKTNKSHHNKTATIAALTVPFLVILAMVFIIWYMNPRKCCPTCFIAPNEHSRQQLVAGKEDEDLPFFNFKTIEMATNCFSPENKLGQGGFGPVYKGILPNGQEIAAKRLSKISGQGIEQFKNEVLLISKLQHRNLVRLLGCCAHGDERILIYEYLPNKSLDSILFGKNERKKVCVDWRKHVSIVDGIAQGLLYLHKYSRMRIIHRDLKTSNILLDIHMHPKISDFGTARIFKDNVYQASTKSIIGTYGYMSPEYAMNGCFSEKSDVFSFGVMIMEIVSGKRNNDFYNSNHVSNLLRYAWDIWIEGRISDLIDPTMEKTVPINEATRFIQVGLLCVQDSAVDRPTMSDVVSMLGNESTVLLAPKQPSFSTVISLKCDDVVNNPKVSGSTNSYMAELWGFREGLIIAKNRGLNHLIAETDSEAMVQALLKESDSPSELNMLIKDCKLLMSELYVLNVVHTFREGNKCADFPDRYLGYYCD